MKAHYNPKDAAVFGIDIGKNLFHVVALDAAGTPIQKATFRRETLLRFFTRAAPVLVGMEALSGFAVAGPQAQGSGPYRQDRSGPVREALCEVEQERHHRCGSDC